MIEELAKQVATDAGLSDSMVPWVEIGMNVGIVATVFLPLISVIAMFSIWWERKVAGHIQGRVGPMHVGLWHGWAQSIADGVKLILKEDLIPKGADSFLFRLAPYLAFAPVFAAFLALPFGPQFIFENGLNIGVLYILAVLSIEVMGTILAGWGSNSKWSIYGAMREACQMVSYEIPLGISIICVLLVTGTINVLELNYLQGKGLYTWFVFHNPFMMLTFILFFVASIAASKRAPFDLPESESELVAGFHTEYSGLRFSFFFFAEYAGMFIVSVIASMLFLGGWNSPLGVIDPVYMGLGYDPIEAGRAYFDGNLATATTMEGTAKAMGLASVPEMFALNVYCAFWVMIKAFTLIYIQMWLRWTMPRIRIDQVLYTCVKVLLPGTLITLSGTAVWVVLEQKVAGIQAGEAIARHSYLTGETNWFTAGTQIILTIIGVVFVLSFVGVVFKAFLTRGTHPPKSFFSAEMPVGREMSFNPGKNPGTSMPGVSQPAGVEPATA